MLLHGQPGSAEDWQQVTDRLPGTLHVVALDRPGYGTSRSPAGGFGYGARAVLAELDARGIGRAVLVGHSYGGGVALSVAQLAPERVEALVLLASVGPDCLTGWDRLLAAPARHRDAVAGDRESPEQILRGFAESIFGDGLGKGFDELLFELAQFNSVLRALRPGDAGAHGGQVQIQVG